ncbi:MAG: YdcF family protein [Sterolibacteriaceae bacterium]|nr:YdcF family protein [Sterolibacteriaceae bacterium]MBK9086232.1 YdcF family protein [Sterolibacteriaceae bacterium]
MDFYPLLLLKRVLAALVLPPAGPVLLALLGVMLARRLPRLGRRLFWLGMLSSLALATPFVANLLVRSLGDTPPLDLADARRAQAIVVLSGSTNFDAPEYAGDTVGGDTLQRVRYAARVAKQTGLPLLTSGGSPEGARPLALTMRDTLERDFGVAVKWTESASLDTRENARFSKDVLGREKIRRIVLITHVTHMPRARRYFEDAGFEVVAAPTVYSRPSPASWYEFVPGASAQQISSAALHEWIGLAAARAGIGVAR